MNEIEIGLNTLNGLVFTVAARRVWWVDSDNTVHYASEGGRDWHPIEHGRDRVGRFDAESATLVIDGSLPVSIDAGLVEAMAWGICQRERGALASLVPGDRVQYEP